MMQKKTLEPTDNLKSFYIEHFSVLLVLAFVVGVCYINSLNNDFVSDDVFGIVNNKIIGTWEYLKQGVRTYPSRLIMHTLSFQLGGKEPFFFRFPVVFTHFLNSVLVFTLFTRLKNKNFGFMTSILFAVHPLLTEAIVWISAGSYVYSAFFTLLSFLLYTYRTKRRQIISIVSFIMALSFSAFSVFLPFALLLYEFSQNKLKRNWKNTLVYFLIIGVSALSFYFMLEFRIESLGYEHNQTASFRNPLIHIPSIIATYIELFLWPQNLTLYHSDVGFSLFGYSTILFTKTAFILKLIVFVLFSALFAWSYFKDRFVFFWLGFFVMAISITFVPYSIVWVIAERYVYLGSVGLFAVFIALFTRLLKGKRNELFIIVFVLAILLGVRTVFRNSNWQNADKLWLSAASISPSSHLNHNNLGDVYRKRGDLDRARREFETAIQLKPDYADAMHNLATTYLLTGNVKEAQTLLEKSIEFKPILWQSYLLLADIYLSQGNVDLAEKTILASLSLNNTDANSYIMYAKVLEARGENDKADQLVKAVLSEQPNNPFALKFQNNRQEKLDVSKEEQN